MGDNAKTTTTTTTTTNPYRKQPNTDSVVLLSLEHARGTEASRTSIPSSYQVATRTVTSSSSSSSSHHENPSSSLAKTTETTVLDLLPPAKADPSTLSLPSASLTTHNSSRSSSSSSSGSSSRSTSSSGKNETAIGKNQNHTKSPAIVNIRRKKPILLPMADEEGKENSQAPDRVTSLPPPPPPLSFFSSSSSFANDYYSPLVIFYNIFIPSTNKGKLNALRIVQDQLTQIQQSYALSAQPSTSLLWQRPNAANATTGNTTTNPVVVPLYYITLGASNVLTPTLMQRYCGGQIACRHVQHYDEGWEVLTLQHMHQFCQAMAASSSQLPVGAPDTTNRSTNRDVRVVYLHNKGSLHQFPVTENWRKSLTEVVVSEHCLGPQALASPCNVCGATFFTTWTLFFPGNMFVAKCDYVQKLIAPSNFSSRMEQAIETVMQLRLQNQLVTHLTRGKNDRTDFFGLERFSDEHWIASHPDIQPCDCNSNGNAYQYKKGRKKLSQMQWSMAPRVYGSPHDGLVDKYDQLKWANATDWRLREYYLLPGNLIKWFSLYHQAPPPDSWAWTWFPDGPFWKHAVAQHGANAVAVMTHKYRDYILLEQPFAATTAETLVNDRTTMFGNHPSRQPGIFYHAYAPPNATLPELQDIQQLAQDQLAIVANTIWNENSSSRTNQRLLYHVTVGHADFELRDVCSAINGLECRPLARHYSENHRGETLRHLYNFCQMHPDLRVIYLQNQTPDRASTMFNKNELKSLLLHGTRAAMSELCLHAENCNLCGLVFFTLPAFMMVPSTWSAECTYINLLLPPEVFVQRMQEFIMRAIFEKLKDRLSFNIVKERSDHLGLGAYSMEHWVGSHPSLLPCDLSDRSMGLPYWTSSIVNASDFQLTSGAHHNLGPSYECSLQQESIVRANKKLRKMEFYLLAGRIFKWYSLYGTVPPQSSFVWRYFPDGAAWTKGVTEHGSNVLHKFNSMAH